MLEVASTAYVNQTGFIMSSENKFEIITPAKKRKFDLIESEVIDNENFPSETEKETPKSILRTTKEAEEFISSLCSPVPQISISRVTFSPTLVSAIIYRDKFTISDRSNLFYSIQEEEKFAKEILQERKKATKLGLTWMEWVDLHVW